MGGDYFAAMGIEIEDGRALDRNDRADGIQAVVVSRALAERWWPGESAIGRRVAAQGGWYTIVGVAGDVPDEALTEPSREVIYWPQVWGAADSPAITRESTIVVRAAGGAATAPGADATTATDPLRLAPVVAEAVAAVNPRIALASVRTLEDIYRGASSRASFTLALLGVSAATALFLGLVGIYGVVSYTASRRTREIGIRIALGASTGSVRGLVVKAGFAMASVGVGVGLVAGRALSSFMESVLFGVSPVDPGTYALAALAVLAVALVASWIPAARAAGVQPTEALRAE